MVGEVEQQDWEERGPFLDGHRPPYHSNGGTGRQVSAHILFVHTYFTFQL